MGTPSERKRLDEQPASSREECLEELYRAHAKAVRLLLVRLGGPAMDAEDLAHEVFLIAWRKLGQLAELPGRSWLLATAVKVAAAARRRARLRRFIGLEGAGPLRAAGTPATEFEKAESSRTVYAALEELSEKKRTVFILFELHGFSGEEIAGLLGCPLKTVWSRLASAREEFTARLSRGQAVEELEGGAI